MTMPVNTHAKSRVIVVGAGIVGASLAYHLARDGADVTVLDAASPASGATGSAFGWINIAAEANPDYASLRHAAVEDWHRLEQDCGGAFRVNWCGALRWGADPAATKRFFDAQVAAGYSAYLIDQHDISAIEANLTDPPSCAVLTPDDGVVEPQAVTRVLLRAARDAGARILPDTQVLELVRSGDRITGARLANSLLQADCIVPAAGIGCRDLCGPFGLSAAIEASPAVLLRFRTRTRLVNGVISAPNLEIRQTSPHRLVAAADYRPDTEAQLASATLAAIRRRFRGGQDTALEMTVVAERPMPVDRLPIVGPVPGVFGLYLAITHSGVTMAATIGRLAAREILSQTSHRQLSFCRAERFTAC